MKNDQISLVIEAPDGRPLRAYAHEGKTFVESHEDRTYRLRVKNRTGDRVKVVLSVDSLNIITGKPAGDDPNETGYILGPYAEEVFKGYRISDDEVAEFKFVKRSKSYATENGQGQGNGVVALRAYAEKDNTAKRLKELQKQLDEWKNRPKEKEYIPYPVYPWRRPYWYNDYYYYGDNVWCGGSWSGYTVGSSTTSSTTHAYTASNSAGESVRGASSVEGAGEATSRIRCCASTLRSTSFQAEAKPQSFDMGSGWGGVTKESVTHVKFEVGELVAEVAVYYATLEGLKSLGVNVTREKAVAFPEPFKRTGYAQPPAGWNSGRS